MVSRLFIWLVIFSIIFFPGISCKKNDTPTDVTPGTSASILNYSINGLSPAVSFSGNNIHVRFDENVKTGKDLIAEFTLSPGAKATVNNTEQVSGATKNDFENTIDYMITSKDGIITHYYADADNNDYSIKWNMGHFVKDSASNDRSYNWYIDQANTGINSNSNCGPTTTTMAMKWADSTFSKTPHDAEVLIPTDNGWYSWNVMYYLNRYSFPYDTASLGGDAPATSKILKDLIASGHVLIIELEMGSISQTTGDSHTGKFYSGDFLHYILLKGYKLVDNELYFEVYDPYDFGAMYADGTPKGMNRFYKSEEIAQACANVWNYTIIMSRK